MIHLRTGTNKANDQHKNLCGGPASNATNNPPFVTCRQCLEKMKELGIEIKAVDYDYSWIIAKN